MMSAPKSSPASCCWRVSSKSKSVNDSSRSASRLTGFAAGFRLGAGLRPLEELPAFEEEEEELRDERGRLVAIPESESISGGEKHESHSFAPATAVERLRFPRAVSAVRTRNPRDSLRVRGDRDRR